MRPYGNVEESLSEGVLCLFLKAGVLKGNGLDQAEDKAGKTKDNWLLLKEKDEYAKTETGISDLPPASEQGDHGGNRSR